MPKVIELMKKREEEILKVIRYLSGKTKEFGAVSKAGFKDSTVADASDREATSAFGFIKKE